MADVKTKVSERSVDDFLAAVEPEQKRLDSQSVCALMAEVTGEEPRMWGASIVGFGQYHYVYESGREADWMLVGFSPRKQNLTLYIMSGFAAYGELMERLGPHKTGKSCLYIKRLSDLNLDVLKELISQSVQHLRTKYAR